MAKEYEVGFCFLIFKRMSATVDSKGKKINFNASVVLLDLNVLSMVAEDISQELYDN